MEQNGVRTTEQRDLFPGALEMMIFQTPRRRPLHGYALGDPALQRMLRAGCLESEWGISSSNRRVRLYRITATGRKHLDREVSSLERMMAAIMLVLAPVHL